MKGRAARRIVRRTCPPVPEALQADDLHPVLARIYAARGVIDRDELAYGLDQLPVYRDLTDVDRATALLEDALNRGLRVLVVGDFDADGATSTALAVHCLRAMGGEADFLVPNRFEYGYGLTPEIVAVAREREPDLIMTVDNGISSIDGVKAAADAGIPVLVTDHHLPGRVLPEAAAIVNPNRPGDGFPCKHLAGVGVVFYLMAALRARLTAAGWFERRGIAAPNLGDYLDLVALGTVADVVPLDRTNRVLVSQGLARMRAGRCRPGIAALLRVAGRDPGTLTAADLGFAVGPRLNAAGRLDDMSIGIACLLANDEAEAMPLATRLDHLNRERRSIEQTMQEEARDHLAELHLESDGELPVGVCLYRPDWHPGVVGLLASKVKEQLHRPVIVFADDGDGQVRGSARSIPGLHIRDTLDAVAARHPGLLTRFGGHAMAAGLSLPAASLDTFREAFDAEARARLDAGQLEGVVLSDGQLAAEEAAMELALLLRNGGPWGQAFPEPLFDGEFMVVNHRILKERHLKMTLSWPDGTRQVDAIVFHADLDHWRSDAARVQVAYRLDINHFGTAPTVQLIVEHLEIVA